MSRHFHVDKEIRSELDRSALELWEKRKFSDQYILKKCFKFGLLPHHWNLATLCHAYREDEEQTMDVLYSWGWKNLQEFIEEQDPRGGYYHRVFMDYATKASEYLETSL